MINFDKWYLAIREVIAQKYREIKFDYDLLGCEKKAQTPPTLIFMIDGKRRHGGMADRLRGLISAYCISKEFGYQFKINHTYPYNLEEYLHPNKVDWTIDDNFKIVRNIRSARLSIITHSDDLRFIENRIRLATKGRLNQIHMYTNITYFPYSFSECFKELFCLPEIIENEINYHVLKIGCDYISITFRFQQLLGDFKEGDFPVLNYVEAKKLIEDCLKSVEIIHARHKDYKKILVTSDSITFLNEVSKIPYVYTIPGEIKHMDYDPTIGNQAIQKSYVDFFMLSNAKHVITAFTPNLLRKTNFPMTAALVSNAPHEWCDIHKLLKE